MCSSRIQHNILNKWLHILNTQQALLRKWLHILVVAGGVAAWLLAKKAHNYLLQYRLIWNCKQHAEAGLVFIVHEKFCWKQKCALKLRTDDISVAHLEVWVQFRAPGITDAVSWPQFLYCLRRTHKFYLIHHLCFFCFDLQM